MKKVVIVAIAAIVAVGFSSCKRIQKMSRASKVTLKTDIDSLSYAIGVAQSQGVQDYILYTLKVDSAYFGDLMKGLEEGAKSSANKKQNAYKAGLALGAQVGMMAKNISLQVYDNDSTASIPLDLFLKGFESGIIQKFPVMNPDMAQAFASGKMNEVKEKYVTEKYKDNKEAGEKFLEEKAKEEGIKKLEGGVLYKVIKEGNGPIPADTSLVEVNYVGKTIKGEEFDNSERLGHPAVFRANQMIKGWTEILTHMTQGSQWEVYIPAEMAYGSRAASKEIKPFSALVFNIELLNINENVSKDNR